jgi:AraC-like DNA-binding protein/CheY-like chemotaxis protein
MRFRAVLIDDEPWVLEGMRVLLPWEAGSLVLGQTYTDSVEALEAILADPPDVIFSDIRMPEVSGLDLLRTCREHGLDCEFIIVSGYSDFQYAQTALKLGAFDYLTKPIDLEKAPDTLACLRGRLIEKRIQRGIRRLDDWTVGQCIPRLPCADAGWLAVCERRTDTARSTDGLWVERLANTYDGVFITETLWVADRVTITLLCVGAEEAGFIRASVRDVTNGYIGVSSYAADGGRVPDLLREAYLAYRQRYVQPDVMGCAYDTCGVSPVREWLRQARKPDEAADKPYGPLLNALRGLPSFFRKNSLQLIHAEYVWNYCMTRMHARVLTAEELADRFDSIDEQCEAMIMLLSGHTLKHKDDSAKRRVNKQFLLLLEEVDERCCQPLSLQDLSSRYFLNLSYASELFRSVTGMRFTEYVTKLRMTRAVQLMKTDKSLQDVASSVGYEDYFYFSKVFKKYYGVSPTRYNPNGAGD